jgi:hypothetical protein|tara:strand:+ start:25 stop:306 length:282 start_codon:yes stop_codon:yes gene_type:complete
MRIRMDIQGWRGDYYARTKNFNSDKHYANYVAYILTNFGEKVIGERRVDPEGMYLEWFNNYLSVEKFAKDYGISEDYALEQINKGKSINLSKA